MRYLIAAAVLGLAGSAMAETWTVDDDGPADFDNIQAAVDAASDGDEILVEPGTYTSTQDGHVVNTLGKAITLRSSQGADVTIIDGENARRVIRCETGETQATVIEGFTITRGDASLGGGVFCSNSNPILTNCKISDNKSPYGGGIFCIDSSPALNGCTISGNTGSLPIGGNGGGIYCNSSSPTLTSCAISDNSSGIGGGISLSQSNATLTNCTISENFADFGASGIYCLASNPTISGCTVSGNHAISDGGGFYCDANSNPTITDCTISENRGNNGGGIYCNASNPTFDACTISDNSAVRDGGGFYCDANSNPELTNCEISGNITYAGGGGEGGGIYCGVNTAMTLWNCEISDNTADDNGGGIFSGNDGNPALIDTVVCGNSPDQIYGDWVNAGGNTITDECPSDCHDINGDGEVGVDEILIVIAEWGTDDTDADINDDGIVGTYDILLVLSTWGPCP